MVREDLFLYIQAKNMTTHKIVYLVTSGKQMIYSVFPVLQRQQNKEIENVAGK